MKKRITVLFHGALAHYEIEKNLLGSYTASLFEYEGPPDGSLPPSVISLYIHGTGWLGHPGEQQLVDDIGNEIPN